MQEYFERMEKNHHAGTILGSVDNSDLDVPRLVRGIQFDLTLCNRLAHEARSLDPADKPRDVGAQKVNCQHALIYKLREIMIQ